MGDSQSLSPTQHPDYHFTLDQAVREMNSHPWPAAVVSEQMEVLAANAPLQRVWRVDLRSELNTPVERNILSVIANPRFEGRLANWDQVVGIAIAVLKGHYLGAETEPQGSSAYFAAVMQHFLEGVPSYVTRLSDIWQRTEPMTPKVRWTCPITWRDPDVGVMNFHAVMSDANEPKGMAFMDWLPLDGVTWERLHSLVPAANPSPAATATLAATAAPSRTAGPNESPYDLSIKAVSIAADIWLPTDSRATVAGVAPFPQSEVAAAFGLRGSPVVDYRGSTWESGETKLTISASDFMLFDDRRSGQEPLKGAFQAESIAQAFVDRLGLWRDGFVLQRSRTVLLAVVHPGGETDRFSDAKR